MGALNTQISVATWNLSLTAVNNSGVRFIKEAKIPKNYFEHYFHNAGSKALVKMLHYSGIYHGLLADIQNKTISFLEIGVYKGGSIGMWESNFHPDCKMTFVDIDPDCRNHATERSQIVIGDQSSNGRENPDHNKSE